VERGVVLGVEAAVPAAQEPRPGFHRRRKR
jgi:hypothetical protein